MEMAKGTQKWLQLSQAGSAENLNTSRKQISDIKSHFVIALQFARCIPTNNLCLASHILLHQ